MTVYDAGQVVSSYHWTGRHIPEEWNLQAVNKYKQTFKLM